MKNPRLLLLPLLLGGLIIAGCGEENPVEPEELQPPNVTLNDLDGDEFQLRSTEGEVVLLHFFAPWCPVCQAEAPELNALHERYKDEGLTIIGVAVAADSLGQVRAFKDQYDVPYRILVDDGRAELQFGINQVPRTFVIDRQVKFQNPPGGYPALTEEEWAEVVQPLL